MARILTSLVLVTLAVVSMIAAEDSLPPVIAEFPEVEDNFVELSRGSPFSLNCKAKGEPTPEVKWFRDDVELKTEAGLAVTDEVLDFAEPSPSAHEGNYHCEAVNEAGRAKSQVILVSATRPKAPEWAIKPTLIKKPEVKIIPVEAIAEFQCTAEGSPKPEIIWTKNGEVLEDFRGKEKLIIERVNKEDEGTYACKAENLVGYDYKMVFLSILQQAPIFIEKPRDRTVSINQEVYLRCAAKGYPEPTISWKFNSRAVAVDNEDESSDFGQSERGDLIIRRVANESAGNYECVATNKHGTNKENGNLKVVSITTIESGPVDSERQVQSEVKMDCTVLWDPAYELNIQWKKDNVDLDFRSDPRIELGEDNKLIIKDLEFDDAGTYTCVATTSQGSSTDSGTLSVVGIPPKVVAGPSAQIVTEGTDVRVLCKVEGFPKPKHRWFKDTDRIYFDHRKPERVSVDEEGSLLIADAEKADSGKYICRASNDYGSPVVESAFIDIRSPTKVVRGPTHQRFVSGENYTLDCMVEVDELLRDDLNVTWLKDDQPIDIETSERYTLYENSSLLIAEVTAEEVGKYSCFVRTPVDEVLIEASIYDDSFPWWWLIVLLTIIAILILLICCCFVCCIRRRSRSKGRYGVKDIEDGKARHNKSDIHYSVEDDDMDADDTSLTNDLLLDGGGDSKSKLRDPHRPIFKPESDQTILAELKGSENSLLNLTDEDLWLRKGMDEDGSFREGRYADD